MPRNSYSDHSKPYGGLRAGLLGDFRATLSTNTGPNHSRLVIRSAQDKVFKTSGRMEFSLKPCFQSMFAPGCEEQGLEEDLGLFDTGAVWHVLDVCSAIPLRTGRKVKASLCNVLISL